MSKYQDTSASRHSGATVRRSRVWSRLRNPLFGLFLWALFFGTLKNFTDLSAFWIVVIAVLLATAVVLLTSHLRRNPDRGDVDVTGL